MQAKDCLIVALDVNSECEALNLVDRLGDQVTWYKVGLQLFTAEGPQVVRQLVRRDKRVFLDLKLHEIPNSVASAIRVAGDLGVSMLTVHASGASKMLRSAAEPSRAYPGLMIIAVTVVTSLTDACLREVGLSSSCEEQALRLAKLAETSGCHGIVASPQEVSALRAILSDRMMVVTPGVRPAQTELQDQSRIATPSESIRRGASHLIIGRPITQAVDPIRATQDILSEMEIAITER